MALQSPAPLLKQFSGSLSNLLETLDPLLARPLAQLSSKLEAGSSVKASGEDAAAKGDAEKAQAGNGTNDSTKGKANGPAAETGKIELSGKLDAARLHASVAYVILDLVWMYLKTKGIDHTTHPVMPELERVKGYFHKIKYAQDADKREARTDLDQSAAARFIRHAIGNQALTPAEQAGRAKNVGAIVQPNEHEAQPQHKRFDFEKEPEGADEDGSDSDESEGTPMDKGKRKAKDSSDANASGSSKRKRVDPFVGYLDPSATAESNKSTEEGTPMTKKAKKKAAKQAKKARAEAEAKAKGQA